MKKGKSYEDKPSLKQRIKDGTLAPEVKQQLESLSKELNMPQESLAELCVMMYRMYGKKA
ncbi:MAG: hypothetical protein PHX65_04840 [Sulfurimonas sp.]|nr:hypothetical protein [Sulfurimonas sp.]